MYTFQQQDSRELLCFRFDKRREAKISDSWNNRRLGRDPKLLYMYRASDLSLNTLSLNRDTYQYYKIINRQLLLAQVYIK